MIWKKAGEENLIDREVKKDAKFELDLYRQKYDLPMKHFSLPITSKYLPKKLEQIKKNGSTLQLDFISG